MIKRLLSPQGITKDERSDDDEGSDADFDEDVKETDKNGKTKPLPPIARKKTKKEN